MKKYNVTYYKDGELQHTETINARNRREALQKAWSMFDVDDVYISEVGNDEQAD